MSSTGDEDAPDSTVQDGGDPREKAQVAELQRTGQVTEQWYSSEAAELPALCQNLEC